jgi:hypothetical protein
VIYGNRCLLFAGLVVGFFVSLPSQLGAQGGGGTLYPGSGGNQYLWHVAEMVSASVTTAPVTGPARELMITKSDPDSNSRYAFADERIALTGEFTPRGHLFVTIQNKSDRSMRFLWHESAFVQGRSAGLASPIGSSADGQSACLSTRPDAFVPAKAEFRSSLITCTFGRLGASEMYFAPFGLSQIPRGRLAAERAAIKALPEPREVRWVFTILSAETRYEYTMVWRLVDVR